MMVVIMIIITGRGDSKINFGVTYLINLTRIQLIQIMFNIYLSFRRNACHKSHKQRQQYRQMEEISVILTLFAYL